MEIEVFVSVAMKNEIIVAKINHTLLLQLQQ